MRAVNSEGAGDASAPVAAIPRRAPDAPEDVVLLLHTGTALKLVWNAPADNGGDEATTLRRSRFCGTTSG